MTHVPAHVQCVLVHVYKTTKHRLTLQKLLIAASEPAPPSKGTTPGCIIRLRQVLSLILL